jgi:uncharacterized protein (DUF302 family)
MRHILILLCFALSASTAAAEEWTVKRKIAGNFVDARDNIVMAIENRGLVINYISHLADMLERTGADLGATRKIYDQAEIIEFCSAGLSRKMLELDPHNIPLCPFAISIYTLPGEKDGTWVSYRQPKGSAAAMATRLLEEIAAEAGQ